MMLSVSHPPPETPKGHDPEGKCPDDVGCVAVRRYAPDEHAAARNEPSYDAEPRETRHHPLHAHALHGLHDETAESADQSLR